MTAINVEEILKKIGWTDGTKVPISNTENAALEAEIERLSLRRHKAFISNENAVNRYNALDKHLKYLYQESEQNQRLIALNKEQLETDQHNFKLKECEREKLRQELKTFKRNITDLEGRIEIKTNDLSKGLGKIEKLKAEAAWDAEALKAWDSSIQKRDEDNELLKKFSKQDEKKAKELEARRINLQVDSNKRKEMIENMVAELTNYEQVMERTGKIVQQLRSEKQTLVARWQETVRNLRQRDDDIKRITKDLELAQEVLVRQKVSVEEQNLFLANEVRNNQQLTAEIQELNNNNSRVRRELNETIEMVLVMTNEANTMKRAVLGISQELEKARTRSKMLTRDIDNKTFQIEYLTKETERLRKKLEDTINSSGNAAERAKYLEDVIEYENKQTNVLASDLTRTQNTLYRTQQKLEDLKATAKLQEMDIQGYQVSMNILQRAIAKKVAELEQHKEMVYDLDFRKCNMEITLSKIEGTVTDDLLEEMITKIKDLQAVIVQHNEVKLMLETQITRLNDERRRLANNIAFENTIIEDLRNKLQNFVLLYEGGLKQTAAAKLLSQKKQVEENVLRLKVDNLSNGMTKQEKHIYNLQKFRLELETAMKERRIEIEANKDILLAKRKNLDEELGRLRCDIMGRNIKIKHLQSKYAVALSMLGKDEFGQPLSIAHFKIKNAQEKYMLQLQGDELDNKIRTAEKEIIAMENTLKVVNYTNARYRNILGPVQDDDQELKDMEDLTKELQDTKIVLRDRKKVLKKRLVDIESFMEILDMKKGTESERANELDEVRTRLGSFAINFEDNTLKIKRANRHLKKVKETLSKIDLHMEEKDFQLKSLQNSNYNGMQQVRDLPKKYPELQPSLVNYFSNYNMELRSSLIKSSSSISDDPVMSMYSTTSSESSGVDYSLAKVSTVDIKLEYPFTKKMLKKTVSKQSVVSKSSDEMKRRASRGSSLPTKMETFSSIYRLSLAEKKGHSLDISEVLHTDQAHRDSESSSTMDSGPKVYSTDDSMNIPSSLFNVEVVKSETIVEEEEAPPPPPPPDPDAPDHSAF